MRDRIKKDSQLLIRLSEDLMYKFKIALAIKNETAQAAVQQAVENYINAAGCDNLLSDKKLIARMDFKGCWRDRLVGIVRYFKL